MGEPIQLGTQLFAGGVGRSGDLGIADAAPPASAAEPAAAATLEEIGASGPPPPPVEFAFATSEGVESLESGLDEAAPPPEACVRAPDCAGSTAFAGAPHPPPPVEFEVAAPLAPATSPLGCVVAGACVAVAPPPAAVAEPEPHVIP